jgi:hypothetical protein
LWAEILSIEKKPKESPDELSQIEATGGEYGIDSVAIMSKEMVSPHAII